MNKMIVANLVHRPIRSVISIVAVAVEVTLILLIVGLALGILDDELDDPGSPRQYRWQPHANFRSTSEES